MHRLFQIILPLFFAVFAGISYHWKWFHAIDLLFYDKFQWSFTYEIPNDIVIISIDEQSLDALGRWPWPRQYHANLVALLSDYKTNTIIFDILFATPDSANLAGDKALAIAIENHGKVVLPVYFEQIRRDGQVLEIPPFDRLYKRAAGIGHVHIECDKDAICRSVYMKEGVGSPHWPHISLASLALDNKHIALSPPGEKAEPTEAFSPMLIYRDFRNFIPFSTAKFQTVSYIDVLRGSIPASVFKGKTIFIGATATGIGDVLATPVGLLPGVEINATIYNSLRQNLMITSLPERLGVLINFFTVALLLICFTFLSPRQLLLANLAAISILFSSSFFLFYFYKLWFPFISTLVAILGFYPLWSWFRLEIALHYLKRSLINVQQENQTIDIDSMNSSLEGNLPNNQGIRSEFSNRGFGQRFYTHKEVIGRTIDQLQMANQATQMAHRLVQQSLSQLQEAVLIFNSAGVLVLKNQLADSYFSGAQSSKLTLVNFGEHLNLSGEEDWQRLSERLITEKKEIQVEAKSRTTTGTNNECKDFFIQGSHSSITPKDAPTTIDILILSLTDVTTLKASERSRMDTLSFISHDLRSPMVSVLALIETTKTTPPNSDNLEVLEKIEHYIKRNLDFAESLLQLSRAESLPASDFELCDIHAIADNAYAQAIPIAKQKAISIEAYRDDVDMWVWGDGDLLERALMNLITNAIKYSAPDSCVKLSILLRDKPRQKQKLVVIDVTDQGKGIESDYHDILFQRFKRAHKTKAANKVISGEKTNKTIFEPSGAGLGLYFVKTVAEKHNGNVNVQSELNHGSTFSLILPYHQMEDEIYNSAT